MSQLSDDLHQPAVERRVTFPQPDGSRVPYSVFSSQEVFDREQERIEDCALHVRGVRRAGCLVRVPERDLSVRIRATRHLRPRLERPCGRSRVEPEVGRRVWLARKRRRAIRPRRAAGTSRAQRVAEEEDWREGDYDDEARDQQPDEIRDTTPPDWLRRRLVLRRHLERGSTQLGRVHAVAKTRPLVPRPSRVRA